LERVMEKPVSAAVANRKFSELLRAVREGRSYVVTSHGAPGARRSLIKRLQSQRVVKIGRWTREELYEDEP
jgi:antitoxin (DNA-binding transcriptional repressor) of toxin-antitoxin stability system